MATLETAGLSRSNPYYIVQQGRVLSLWRMSDDERLSLLKDVAGTRVYEARRDQSTRELEGTQAQRRQIDDVIQYIDKRLGELEEEKEELHQYKDLDRRQRALQYTVCQRDIDEAAEELERETNRVEALSAPIEDKRMELQQAAEELEGKQEARRTVRADADAARAEAEAAEATSSRLATRAAQLRVDSEAARGAVERAEADAKERDAKLGELRSAAAAAEKDLEALRPEREERAKAHAAALGEVQRVSRRVEALEEKAGRAKQFRTRAERDAWLDGEAERLGKQLRSKEEELAAQERRKAASAASAQAKHALAGKSREAEEGAAARHTELAKELEELRVRRREFVQQRETQRAEADLRRDLDRAKTELADAEQGLRRTMRSTQWHGLAGLEDAARELGVQDRVHGPLLDLVELSTPAAATAVEVIGGNSLFNVVVDDEEVATRLLRHMRSKKVGRLTFAPLAELRAQERALPADAGDDAVLLTSQLAHEDRVHKAVVQVFGKALLCRDTTVAARLATPASKFTCVTADGTKVAASGEVSGGYHDAGSLRITAWQRHKEASRRVARATRLVKEAEEEAAQRRQEATHVVQRIQQCEAELTQLRSKRNAAVGERQRAEADTVRFEKDAAEAKERIAALQATLEDLRDRRDARVAERGTPMRSDLGGEEEAELQDLRAQLPEAQKALREAQAALDDVNGRATKLSSMLEIDYAHRIAALEAGPDAEEEEEALGGEGTPSTAAAAAAPTSSARRGRKGRGRKEQRRRSGGKGKRSRSRGMEEEEGEEEEEEKVVEEDQGFGEEERIQSLEAAQHHLASLQASLAEAEAELNTAQSVAKEARRRATRMETELQQHVEEAEELEGRRQKLDREVSSLAAKVDKVRRARSATQMHHTALTPAPLFACVSAGHCAAGHAAPAQGAPHGRHPQPGLPARRRARHLPLHDQGPADAGAGRGGGPAEAVLARQQEGLRPIRQFRRPGACSFPCNSGGF